MPELGFIWIKTWQGWALRSFPTQSIPWSCDSMKSSCEDDSKSAFTPNVFPLHWWPGGSWMYRSHWRTAKKILKLLPKTLLQWWEKQGGEFPPQFESWQITGKATELRSGSMISPKIKAGLGSSSKNLSGGGERLSTDGFQAQEEPECSSGSTQPQVIKYFTFFFFFWEMRELIQRSHPAQNQGKATFPLPIQPPLQRLDSKTNPDIPRNRRDF